MSGPLPIEASPADWQASALFSLNNVCAGVDSEKASHGGRSCRPVGVLYAPYMAFSGSQGAVTSEQNVALLAVFSEAITGLSTSNFKVQSHQLAAC